jgi:signal peptidase II
MLSKVWNRTGVYLLAALVILLDQWSKHLIRTKLALNESWSPLPALAPYVRLLHIGNTGAAFGLFKSGGLVFAVIAVIVSVVIIYYAWQLPDDAGWMRLALGLQLGGALGNLIDRLVLGPVTDFISVGSFAIFNVADASISVGVAMLALLMWFEARAARRPAAPPPAEPADLGPAT